MISLGGALCVDGVITDGMFSVHPTAQPPQLVNPIFVIAATFLIFPRQITLDWQ